MLSGANCLLLDEPTNHLDIDSMEVLESALESYDGTVIVISHDRYLLDRIPDRIVEVRDGQAFSSPGGYDDWLEAAGAGLGVSRASARARSSARSSRAGRARGWSSGGSGPPARRSRGSPTRPTGAARCRGSATPTPGCSCSGSPRRPTAATAPAASSPETVPATSCSRRCIAPGSRTSRRAWRVDDGLRLQGAYVTAVNRCAPPANKPTPARARPMPALPRARDRGAGATARGRRRSASFAGTGRCGRSPRSDTSTRPEAPVRARRRGDRRALHAARVLPSAPAEHLHREAHRCR